jgi:hypothetical protein
MTATAPVVSVKATRQTFQPAALEYTKVSQPASHAERLYQRKSDRSNTCILDYFFASLFSLFLHLIEAWHYNCKQLHDNARVDVRRDAHGKYTESAESAASEEVQETQNAVVVKELSPNLETSTPGVGICAPRR